MFTTPAIDVVSLANTLDMRGSFGRFKSRVRGLPEFGGELPVATLAEEIETPGDDRIRALITMAGNPVVSAPNGRTIERALGKLDFMVSIDLYKNETTRHATLILPPTFGLERDHYDMVLYAFAVHNHARYAKPIFQPRGETRDDWNILTDLALRLASRGSASPRKVATRAALATLRAMGQRGVLDMLLRTGPQHVSLRALEREPHGIDLGPLEPRLAKHLGKRKLRLTPKVFVADVPRLVARLDARPTNDDALDLIGRRHLRSNNSWMHNSDRLTKGPRACTLLLHPVDAKKRGITNGEFVLVRSRVGQVRIEAEISDEMRQGVVSIPHGWGHDRQGVELRVAKSRAGVSANDLTDETFLDGLTGTASFSGVRVHVEKIEPVVLASAE
jgi:anaerobic selenocysteine-containing dehydrogenase